MPNNSAILRGEDLQKVTCEVRENAVDGTLSRRLIFDFGNHQVAMDEAAINAASDAMEAALRRPEVMAILEKAYAGHAKDCPDCGPTYDKFKEARAKRNGGLN